MSKIIVTGWAWFIGSVVVGYLNRMWCKNIVITDNLNTTEKWKNLVNKTYDDYIDRNTFLELVISQDYIEENDIVIHMWACSATTELDSNYLMYNNAKYSYTLLKKCEEVWARFIYASSAATYGDGEKWYNDSELELSPLNMYWYSKYLFDKWVIRDTENFQNTKTQTVGLKFFNVYGPNEYHKWKMASVVMHWFNQIKNWWKISLFKSYKEWFEDWWQKRDFIYVMDVAKVIYFFIQNPNKSWIFNLWTWTARPFYDLASSTFKALDLQPNIDFIEMPESLRPKYQYYTQAEMSKLKSVGYNDAFYSLEEGVKDYVQNYLDKGFQIY